MNGPIATTIIKSVTFTINGFTEECYIPGPFPDSIDLFASLATMDSTLISYPTNSIPAPCVTTLCIAAPCDTDALKISKKKKKRTKFQLIQGIHYL